MAHFIVKKNFSAGTKKMPVDVKVGHKLTDEQVEIIGEETGAHLVKHGFVEAVFDEVKAVEDVPPAGEPLPMEEAAAVEEAPKAEQAAKPAKAAKGKGQK